MGKSIVNLVIDALVAEGIRAQRAMPGGRMPELQSAAAAVQLAEVNQADATATVLVTAMVPAKLGGESCETLALEISAVLGDMGGVCLQGKIDQLDGTMLLAVPVSVEFEGYETEDGWQELPEPVPEPEPEVLTFQVSLNGTVLANAVGFSAWRQEEQEDGVVTGIANAAWHFALEELLPLDAKEETSPQEPFTITVSRSGRTETYAGCTITSHKRVITSKGQSQIREGVAESLTVS